MKSIISKGECASLVNDGMFRGEGYWTEADDGMTVTTKGTE